VGLTESYDSISPGVLVNDFIFTWSSSVSCLCVMFYHCCYSLIVLCFASSCQCALDLTFQFVTLYFIDVGLKVFL